MKDRTVIWIEKKILKVLSKQKIVKFYLGISAQVLENVRSIREQRLLDKAIDNLISAKKIKKTKDDDNITCYSLA